MTRFLGNRSRRCSTPCIRAVVLWLTARLPCRIISGPNGEPYLERYFLFRAIGVTACIHRFVADDPDRGLHDHPWGWAASLVLVGGYYEQRLISVPAGRVLPFRADRPDTHNPNPIIVHTRFLWPGRFNFLRGDDFHRGTLRCGRAEAWTVFVHGPRRKGWGFVKYIPTASGHNFQRYEPFALTREGAFDRWWETAPSGQEQRRKAA